MQENIDLPKQNEILTVSRLNHDARALLEEAFAEVWVEGEISNFAAPHSGHWYFSLKDAAAQVRCAMFRGSQRKLPFQPKDGMHVLIRARVSLYENRGEFQLIAEHMEERGEGKLRRAYELLKKKLEAGGLFDIQHKKSLPLFPKKIGIITSATGAAVRDILTVLKRRYAAAPIIIYPTLVQGETAAPAIVAAIQTANRRNECDVLILARGGGSLEDLWPFNEEIVAHAIFQSTLPIISGVGHEVDFTIADFVADKRAPTPSAAAEILTPVAGELLQQLLKHQQQLLRILKHKMQALTQQLHYTNKHLYQLHPKKKLSEKMQQLDFCELTLIQLQQRLLMKAKALLQDKSAQLDRLTPIHRIQLTYQHLHLALQQLENNVRKNIAQQQANLAHACASLDALSPLATLKRGYAIATHNNAVIRNATDVKQGDEMTVRLMQGSLHCTVKDIMPHES